MSRLRGPQTFTFYRLWENYKAMLCNSCLFRSPDENDNAGIVVRTSVNDFALLNTLVECRLIQSASSVVNPRYRCVAPRSVVEICARTVGIRLEEHLLSD